MPSLPWRAFRRIYTTIESPFVRRAAPRLRAAPRVRVRNATAEEFGEAPLLTPERVGDTDADAQLLYFTASSLTADARSLFFISHRTGHPNLFVRDLATGTDRQLSDNADGWLKSYVYFVGTPYRGFGKASPCLHAASGTAFYIQGRTIVKVDSLGHRVTLNELPDGQMTGYTHVSADGRFLCIPTVDARALDGNRQLRRAPAYSIAQRVRNEGLSSYLRVFDTQSGAAVACEPVRGGWVTHVQFSPQDARLILYNHEWCDLGGIDRLWLWDGRTHRRLRREGRGRQARDWVSHEVWTRDGRAIVYHGAFVDGAAYVARMTLDGAEPVELPLPARWRSYGHFNALDAATLVSDGYYDAAAVSSRFFSLWISRIDVDWEAREMRWRPLCPHLTSWRSQDSHPHPIVDHVGRFVYFTSDRDGRQAIYRVPLGECATRA